MHPGTQHNIIRFKQPDFDLKLPILPHHFLHLRHQLVITVPLGLVLRLQHPDPTHVITQHALELLNPALLLVDGRVQTGE